MYPAALELLMDRLAVRDRKMLTGSAMVCAEQWNIARDRAAHPESFTAADFLPETREMRRQRLQAEADAMKPPSPDALAAWKAQFVSIGKTKS